MEGNEQVSVPKLKIIACKHPDAVDTTKGQKMKGESGGGGVQSTWSRWV